MYFRYDGAGNDFLIADARADAVPATLRERADLARILCDRERGAGADGLLVLEATENPAADVAMRVYNADGSQAEMCGNGARCAVVHALRGPRPEARAYVVLDTHAGLVRGDLVEEADPARGGAYDVRIDLGAPVFRWDALGAVADRRDAPTLPESSLHPIVVKAGGREYELYGASLGNPHVVAFVPDPAAIDLAKIGPEIERHDVFTHGANVHFVRAEASDRLVVRHWERGSGATRACGTGAVASAAVAIRLGLVYSPVTVDVPGGRLRVEWRGGSARLIGPVRAHGAEAGR